MGKKKSMLFALFHVAVVSWGEYIKSHHTWSMNQRTQKGPCRLKMRMWEIILTKERNISQKEWHQTDPKSRLTVPDSGTRSKWGRRDITMEKKKAYVLNSQRHVSGRFLVQIQGLYNWKIGRGQLSRAHANVDYTEWDGPAGNHRGQASVRFGTINQAAKARATSSSVFLIPSEGRLSGDFNPRRYNLEADIGAVSFFPEPGSGVSLLSSLGTTFTLELTGEE